MPSLERGPADAGQLRLDAIIYSCRGVRPDFRSPERLSEAGGSEKRFMADNTSNLIVSDPGVMMGKPVVAGTRITVELILEKLAAGHTVDDVLTAHPHLTREGVQAAIAYAAQVMRMDVVYPTSDVA